MWSCKIFGNRYARIYPIHLREFIQFINLLSTIFNQRFDLKFLKPNVPLFYSTITGLYLSSLRSQSIGENEWRVEMTRSAVPCHRSVGRPMTVTYERMRERLVRIKIEIRQSCDPTVLFIAIIWKRVKWYNEISISLRIISRPTSDYTTFIRHNDVFTYVRTILILSSVSMQLQPPSNIKLHR